MCFDAHRIRISYQSSYWCIGSRGTLQCQTVNFTEEYIAYMYMTNNRLSWWLLTVIFYILPIECSPELSVGWMVPTHPWNLDKNGNLITIIQGHTHLEFHRNLLKTWQMPGILSRTKLTSKEMKIKRFYSRRKKIMVLDTHKWFIY